MIVIVGYLHRNQKGPLLLVVGRFHGFPKPIAVPTRLPTRALKARANVADSRPHGQLFRKCACAHADSDISFCSPPLDWTMRASIRGASNRRWLKWKRPFDRIIGGKRPVRKPPT
jgi:hypothetical protein